ncbi:hypothetical protein BDQ17DRAFT_1330308 [Cyathus striatus]|nr:hypothetical protein BDQ17DRAFT_1330308 [Cyathus striatus]
MRFALFTALILSATSAVSAIPAGSVAELNSRQLGSCDIVSCATGLLTTIPGLLTTATSVTLPLLLGCTTNLLSSPTTAVPTCLATVLVITGVTATGVVYVPGILRGSYFAR